MDSLLSLVIILHWRLFPDVNRLWCSLDSGARTFHLSYHVVVIFDFLFFIPLMCHAFHYGVSFHLSSLSLPPPFLSCYPPSHFFPLMPMAIRRWGSPGNLATDCIARAITEVNTLWSIRYSIHALQNRQRMTEPIPWFKHVEAHSHNLVKCWRCHFRGPTYFRKISEKWQISLKQRINYFFLLAFIALII